MNTLFLKPCWFLEIQPHVEIRSVGSKIVPMINTMSKIYITRLQMPKSTALLSNVTQLMAEMRKTVHAHKGQEPRAFSLTPGTGKRSAIQSQCNGPTVFVSLTYSDVESGNLTAG